MREQLRKAEEREQQAQQEKARLLSLFEAEQAARRDLETKLLPAPRPAPTGKVRVWALVGLLAVVAAFAGWRWRDRIVAVLAP
jgi:ferric-dicitrate binding protein FerR (iron transport regulator)